MDRYTLKARLFPVILVFLPIFVLGIVYSIELKNIWVGLGSFGVTTALIFLFSELGRDKGKIKETGLWKSWGGSPSIQILRWRNSHLDINTKKRYHDKLCSLCPADHKPDENYESSNPNETDEIYKAWTIFMIGKTRDTKKFRLLFKENMSYGFRRNLWGLKPFSVTLLLLLITANYLYWSFTLQNCSPLLFPQTFWYSEVVLGGILFFWLLVVNKSWIKIISFSYAERLFEAVSEIN